MKPLLATLFVALLLLISSTGIGTDTYVYICVSKSSYAYLYNSNCRGLSRCKHEVRKVTLKDAIYTYNRKLCGY